MKRQNKKRRYKKKKRAVFPKQTALFLAFVLTVYGLYGRWRDGNLKPSELVQTGQEFFAEARDYIERLDVQNLLDGYLAEFQKRKEGPVPEISLGEIPDYDGSPYVVINGNVPDFTEEEMGKTPFEFYSSKDYLGRCGMAQAMIDESLMPDTVREGIGMVKPSGWHTAKYDCVDGKYLYNRCHLIAYMLTGENANEKNLITGTRYLNIEGMLPFENRVNDYIEETGDKVMYRVTPVYNGNNLLASGVHMEAKSVKEGGLAFNIYAYNVQPGVSIDYTDGDSWLDS